MSEKDYIDNLKSLICSSKSREEVIGHLERENGEDWAQSSDFIKFIFELDELPSRKFMRRRNNG